MRHNGFSWTSIIHDETIDLSDKHAIISPDNNVPDNNVPDNNTPNNNTPFMDDVPFETFTRCTKLALRQNKIQTLCELPQSLINTLQHYDLYDNNIITATFTNAWLDSNLQILDISYNKITSINLSHIAHSLRELYLIGNQINNLDSCNVSCLTNLTILELGDNNITSVGHGIHALVNLRELYIGSNSLDENSITALGTLPALELLHLQGNMITSLKQLGYNNKLQHLYVGANPLITLRGIEMMHTLVTIDAQKTLIEYIDDDILNVGNFPKLEELDLSMCRIWNKNEVAILRGFVDASDTIKLINISFNVVETQCTVADCDGVLKINKYVAICAAGNMGV